MAALREWLDCRVGAIRHSFRRPLRGTIRAGSMPRRLASDVVYILTEDGQPWQAVMICPCGCGAVLEMNLLPDDRPVWKASFGKKGRPTLHPSIWRKVGCKSHFFVREGQVIWCERRAVKKA
jgi:hypothetical protein